MTSSVRRLVAVLVALPTIVLVLVACGGVPSDSVATVDGHNITRSNFDHWMQITVNSSRQPGQPVIVPDPPRYQRCIAAARRAQPKQSKAQPKTSDAQLKTSCANMYAQLKQQALGQLIQARWVLGEAADRNIKVSDAEVRQRLEQQKKSSFKTEKDFQAFLKSSGMTMDDLLFRVRLDLLASKLRDRVTKGQTKVSDAEVAAYYAKHKGQFATPERRDIRLVLARSKAQAEAAKKALQSGTSFKAVAKKYSKDPQSKANGGLLPGVVRGQQDPGLDKPAFAAARGKLIGPVKGQFGWYVFRVDKVSKAVQESLAQVKPSIRQQLISQRQQKSLNAFIKDFRKKWTDKTDCRQGYKVEGCKGYKAPKTTAQPGPQGQPPPSGQQPGQ